MSYTYFDWFPNSIDCGPEDICVLTLTIKGTTATLSWSTAYGLELNDGGIECKDYDLPAGRRVYQKLVARFGPPLQAYSTI